MSNLLFVLISIGMPALASEVATLVECQGKIVKSEGDLNEPFELHSITKSIVWAAVGHALDQGKIRSLDQVVSTWLPDWKTGRKSKITLRHILEQTSGLSHAESDEQIVKAPNYTTYVRGLKVITEPGKEFSYNNEAVQILAEIMARATGHDLVSYTKKNIFDPLEIKKWEWSRDPSGGAKAYTGIHMSSQDLKKFGEMILGGGIWHGRKILSPQWIDSAFHKRHHSYDGEHSLLWWVIEPNTAYAWGWKGQYLVIDLKLQMVAVQLRHHPLVSDDRFGEKTFALNSKALCQGHPDQKSNPNH